VFFHELQTARLPVVSQEKKYADNQVNPGEYGGRFLDGQGPILGEEHDDEQTKGSGHQNP
jgi:hypothetical protein